MGDLLLWTGLTLVVTHVIPISVLAGSIVMAIGLIIKWIEFIKSR